MTYDIHLVFDCADPDLVSRFWLAALEGYDYPGSDPEGPPGSPPLGFASWDEWADANEIPEAARNAHRTIIDTTGKRPDIHFLAVPEPKRQKNRLHLDIKASAGVPSDRRRDHQDVEAHRLVEVGASIIRRVGDGAESHLILADPEGNEFCVT